MNFENIRVKPVTYKLNISDDVLKTLNPCFSVSAGSFSKMSKKSTNLGGSPNFDEDLQIQRKEKANINVELRDANSYDLIGRGHIEYDSLSSKEGKFNEWIPLKDLLGNEVGRALVEVEISPQQASLGFDSYNFGLKGIMDEMHERMDRIFGDTRRRFDEFALSMFPEAERFLGLGSGDSSRKMIGNEDRTGNDKGFTDEKSRGKSIQDNSGLRNQDTRNTDTGIRKNDNVEIETEKV